MEHVYCKTDTVYRAMANMEKSIWEAEREAEKEENKENAPDRTEVGLLAHLDTKFEFRI